MSNMDLYIYYKAEDRKLKGLKWIETTKERSSYEGRKVDALALGAEEGRDKLRKATGSCT